MDRVKILVRVTVRAGVRVAVRGSRGVAPLLEWSWLLLACTHLALLALEWRWPSVSALLEGQSNN